MDNKTINSKIDKNQLKAQMHRNAQRLGITLDSHAYTTLFLYFFMEEMIRTISESEYRDNFVIKGGIYLSNLIGFNRRVTTDVDFKIKGFDANEKTITEAFETIFSRPNKYDIKFSINFVMPIIERTQYGGFRLSIGYSFDQIKGNFHIDMGIGDVVIPGEYLYDYKCNFDGSIIKIWAYSLESMIAEKFHAMYESGITSSRYKDYYDIFIYYNFLFERLNVEYLREACTKTFALREKEFDWEELKEIVLEFRDNPTRLAGWKRYCKKNEWDYLDFNLVIDSCLKMIDFVGGIDTSN